MLNFRLLKAEEIDVRVGQYGAEWITLLLYKDARCDMAILDETVGPTNWKKSYSRDNANCTLSIWDSEKNQWIDKEDSGSAGNFERDKSLASDSFKRAAVSWGIGRELYTGPILYFPVSGLKNYNAEKKFCGDKFRVTDIAYDDQRRITFVQVRDITSGTEYKINQNKIQPIIVKESTPVITKAEPKAPITDEIDGEVDTTNSLPFDT